MKKKEERVEPGRQFQLAWISRKTASTFVVVYVKSTSLFAFLSFWSMPRHQIGLFKNPNVLCVAFVWHTNECWAAYFVGHHKKREPILFASSRRNAMAMFYSTPIRLLIAEICSSIYSIDFMVSHPFFRNVTTHFLFRLNETTNLFFFCRTISISNNLPENASQIWWREIFLFFF